MSEDDPQHVTVKITQVDFKQTEESKRWGFALQGIKGALDSNGYGNMTAPVCLGVILHLAKFGLGVD